MKAMPTSLPAHALRRRRIARGMLGALTTAWLCPGASWARPAAAAGRALREMQIHRVPALGLEIWVENQPAWETALSGAGAHPGFVAQSPERHHPPVVMTYAGWPRERVQPDLLPSMATTAIRRAGRNFGLTMVQSRSLLPTPAAYGVLQGFEAAFEGTVAGIPMDVKVFVGHTPGRFPVALGIYTLRGKMPHLNEYIRRGWGRLRYLAA